MYFHHYVIISPWKRAGPFIWTHLNPLHVRMLCTKFGWNWLRRRFFNFVNVFSLFCNYFPLEKDKALHMYKLEFPSPKDGCSKFGWNWLSGFEEDFLILSMHFRYFIIISPWKRAGSFIWINLNPLHSRMFWAKFGWNWPSGSEEEDF